MVLRIISFLTCDIDDSWRMNDSSNAQFSRESFDPNVKTTIQAKAHKAGIAIDFMGEKPLKLKFKKNAVVTIRGHVLAFDTSSLQLEA
jgi:hypothetical protein